MNAEDVRSMPCSAISRPPRKCWWRFAGDRGYRQALPVKVGRTGLWHMRAHDCDHAGYREQEGPVVDPSEIEIWDHSPNAKLCEPRQEGHDVR